MRLMTALAVMLFNVAYAASYVDTQSAESWRGRSMDAVINSWGQPDMTIKRPNGNTTLVYQIETTRAEHVQTSPAIGVTVTPHGAPIMTTSPTTNPALNQSRLSLICVIRFEANKSGIIMNVQSQGNGCQ